MHRSDTICLGVTSSELCMRHWSRCASTDEKPTDTVFLDCPTHLTKPVTNSTLSSGAERLHSAENENVSEAPIQSASLTGDGTFTSVVSRGLSENHRSSLIRSLRPRCLNGEHLSHARPSGMRSTGLSASMSH